MYTVGDKYAAKYNDYEQLENYEIWLDQNQQALENNINSKYDMFHKKEKPEITEDLVNFLVKEAIGLCIHCKYNDILDGDDLCLNNRNICTFEIGSNDVDILNKK